MKCPRFEHMSRRALLKGCVGTAAGTAMMNWGSLFSSETIAAETKKKQKHCILLWMNGGASQLETFDMKPGKITGGMYRPISTNVAGTHCCELMPNIAKNMDKLAVINSMHTSDISHPGGIHLMHTAYRATANIRYPELGAIVAKYHGNEESGLPNFIKISSQGNSGAGFLGPRYQPFGISHDGRVSGFATSRLDPKVEARRSDLRNFLEEQYMEGHKGETSEMHHQAFESARRLSAASKAFNIDKEWEKYKDIYGDSKFGRRCLLARKLVEEGVAFVEVGQSGYDTHADNFVGHRSRLPPMEQAWAALMNDLEDRGLLQDTLIVWMGEIGRQPHVNNRSGRDHYVRNWSTALAGAGIKGGIVYGKTNDNGTDVAENPVTENDFFATVYEAIGISHKTEHYMGIRPIPVAGFHNKPIKEILA